MISFLRISFMLLHVLKCDVIAPFAFLLLRFHFSFSHIYIFHPIFQWSQSLIVVRDVEVPFCVYVWLRRQTTAATNQLKECGIFDALRSSSQDMSN
jgi:hypothetical protein